MSPPWSGRRLDSNPIGDSSAPYPLPAQIVAEAQCDTARCGDYQHLEAPDLLWTGAILADRAQKDRRERPLNKRDFLLDDLIGSGLYDQEAANSFLERSQRYTATCVSALYDHVVDMKRDVSVIVSTLLAEC